MKLTANGKLEGAGEEEEEEDVHEEEGQLKTTSCLQLKMGSDREGEVRVWVDVSAPPYGRASCVCLLGCPSS